ncbi:MAG: SDR family oxidoreductase [Oscillospiraceae bacterium]|nr:SDR family oxidoreductase [Oscillospiraceae bacterium]MBQ3225265.1 SDR family oxidoreductase [Oscillospiraceae bacterium]MBQ6697427.1 SDR family oxidoreductase [Oscillospiraceae bacterium]
MKLKGKVAVITGGASGIGEAGTRRFSAEGAQVVILDVNEAAGKALEGELCDVWFIKTDISDEASVKAAFEQIAQKHGKVDVLYNNASVFLGGRDNILDEVEGGTWKKVLAINLDGTYHCTKFAIPLMKEHGGAIINTASSAGVVGIPGCAAYTATKGATVTLTRSLAVDYGKYNIRTNCIAPAAIETEMVKESNLNDPNFDNEFFLKQITPLKRWGKPEDVAALAAFLASDDASYLNGVIIPCDGGITINGTVNKEI